MILDELILHNFGIYRGPEHIQLTPTSPNRPIVLFGGLNGSGKTTMLDALKLVLYGKLADCSNRRDLSYEDFLSRCIHRDVAPEDGAAVELRFRHRQDGRERIYRIRRSWALKRRHVGEQVEVYLDGKVDEVTTEHWAELVEDFIPSRLAQFFFFDGEKIESLADLEKSAEVLASALQSLLGLDLVDQAQTDLKVVERRQKEKQRSKEEQEALEASRKEAERLDAKRVRAIEEHASKNNEVDRHRKRVHELEEEFRKAGGELFEKRTQLEARKKTVEEKLAYTRESLRALAADSAPLLLVRDLVDDLAARSSRLDTQLQQTLLTVLSERDEKLLEVAKQTGIPPKSLEHLKRFLLQDRESRQPARTSDDSIRLSIEASQDVTALRTSLLAEAQTRAALLLKEVQALDGELTQFERQLSMVPDEEAVSSVARKLDKARKEFAKAEAALQVAMEEVHSLQQECSRKWEAFARLLEKDVEESFRHEEADRIVHHAQGVRSVLEQFRLRVVERHIRRIEQLILEGFQHLLRKESLVSRLAIDPSTYRMSLYGVNGQLLSPDRLSAGERQLLAVSIIWGLARAAGRPLPVVIDTPLGRLDSVHRRNLVDRYFPAASHQVLLLSTDEEIDESGLERLKGAVGSERIYRITYNERERSSRVERGYFW
ncbi:DNA sulfur modification protein DndD [Corallococcus sp. M7]